MSVCRAFCFLQQLRDSFLSGQVAAANLSANRNVQHAPPYAPGTSVQAGVASPSLQQTMGHSSMMTTQPQYPSNPQLNFGVASPVYPPGATPGYFPGAGPANVVQGQYAGGTGLANAGVNAASQNQMQFAAQTLPITLPQAPGFATFPNSHALPLPSSSLVQAGAGPSAGQLLPGGFCHPSPLFFHYILRRSPVFFRAIY